MLLLIVSKLRAGLLMRVVIEPEKRIKGALAPLIFEVAGPKVPQMVYFA